MASRSALRRGLAVFAEAYGRAGAANGAQTWTGAKAQHQHDRKHIKAGQPTWSQVWRPMHGGRLQEQGGSTRAVRTARRVWNVHCDWLHNQRNKCEAIV